jgi:hypothetical protein
MTTKKERAAEVRRLQEKYAQLLKDGEAIRQQRNQTADELAILLANFKVGDHVISTLRGTTDRVWLITRAAAVTFGSAVSVRYSAMPLRKNGRTGVIGGTFFTGNLGLRLAKPEEIPGGAK